MFFIVFVGLILGIVAALVGMSLGWFIHWLTSPPQMSETKEFTITSGEPDTYLPNFGNGPVTPEVVMAISRCNPQLAASLDDRWQKLTESNLSAILAKAGRESNVIQVYSAFDHFCDGNVSTFALLRQPNGSEQWWAATVFQTNAIDKPWC